MRIVALEKEIARYKVQIEIEGAQGDTEATVEELLRKIDVLEKVHY
jgi:hypothetical protein